VRSGQFVKMTNYFNSISAKGGTCKATARALVALICVCFGFGVSAETNTVPVKEPPMSKRYLFVLETSHAMQRRADGTLQAIQNLLSSGIGGQLRRGDTIGFWTYDADLHAGNFALQRWTPDTHRPICLRVANFVKEQKYQGVPKIEKVLAAMESVIKDSPLITIIFISDGTQEIQGTPFDERISESFKMWRSEQQSARMPLITVLRGVEGKLAQFTVNPAQWQVEVPPLPDEYQKPQVTKVVTNAPTAKPPPVIGQPLIISGKKSTETPKTSTAQSTAPPAPAPQKEPDVTPQSPKITIAPTTAPQTGTSAPTVSDTSTTKSGVTVSEPPKVSAPPATTVSEAIPSSPAAKPKIDDTRLAAPAKPDSAVVTLNSEVVTHPAEPIVTPTERSRNAAPPVAATEKSANPQPQPSAMTRSAEAVVPTPAASWFPAILLWIAVGIVVLLIIGGVMVLRRSRPVSQASLITRSIDRRGE
jgi:hypothetical protein